jgi:hypothetical protein
MFGCTNGITKLRTVTLRTHRNRALKQFLSLMNIEICLPHNYVLADKVMEETRCKLTNLTAMCQPKES